MGYKDAADMVVERAIESKRGMDTLVYPVAFLYRHYLELCLKELVIHGEQLLDKVDSLKHVHRIDLLWKTVRKLLEVVWPDGSSDDLDAVENCICEFCQFDSQSMSFRYPITKDGTPTLLGLQNVNLQHLKAVMERTSSLLEASSGAINDFLSEKNSHFDSDY